MAIIYSYPGIGTVSPSDVLPICDMSEEGFPTRSITMAQIASFAKGASGEFGVNLVESSDPLLDVSSSAPGGKGDVDLSLKLGANEAIVGNPNGDKTAIKSTDSNGSLRLPSGNTAERPANPKVGEIRFNSQECQLEVYIDGSACGLGIDGWYSINVTAP